MAAQPAINPQQAYYAYRESRRGTLLTFGSIASILFGGVLILLNMFTSILHYGASSDEEVGLILGVFLLAAGITGLWMKRRRGHL